MSNFGHSSDNANTLYFLVYLLSNNYIWDVGDGAFEVVGTWNNARVGECDILMTAAGDAHFGVFPSVPLGQYFIQVRRKLGANPATNDLREAQGEMHWDGSGEISWSSEQGIKWLKNG